MRRRWLAGVFAVSAIFAVLVAVFSSDSVHRLWGTMAACGYALALVVSLAARQSRATDVALGLSFCGALLAPLTWMAAKGIEQPEVWVVARSGATLIHQGTPYAPAAALAGTQNPNAYDPYLPVVALFGLPRAIFHSGLLTDPRVWFGIVFLAVFWLALRRGGARDPGRWVILVAASPVIAFELAVGGTDVPMVAFLCLGFAYLYTGSAATHPNIVLAGLALGIAAAMKATAWPALVVAVVLLAVRDGRRAAGVFTLTSLAVVAACVGPFLTHPKSLVENTIKFPLGLAHVTSAAASPLLGHIIASTWHSAGHAIVVGLLVAAAVGVALSLVFRPPRSVPRAVLLLAGAMTLMFVLAPSTRFGYFIYPATLAIWLLAVRAGPTATRSPATPDPGEPPARPRTSRPTTPATRPAA
jgi:4-amino-4-deoxy-L-arabinose transferase-like glycosyltransferase